MKKHAPLLVKDSLIMKYLKQFLIILSISLVGELLKYLLPLPIPASIYGMVILFVALLTGCLLYTSSFNGQILTSSGRTITS